MLLAARSDAVESIAARSDAVESMQVLEHCYADIRASDIPDGRLRQVRRQLLHRQILFLVLLVVQDPRPCICRELRTQGRLLRMLWVSC